jgi:CRISPR-associated endonuclease Csn1
LIWNGKESLGKVKHIVHNKNAVHLTRYAFCRKGGLFDQQPKAFPEGAIPRKEGLSVEKYGGYCKATASFFVLAKYCVGKKTDIMLVPVDLMASKLFDCENQAVERYVCEMINRIIGKNVTNVEFPIGLRKIKINTMLDFDGMRMCIAGKSSGGKAVIPSLSMPLIVSYDWEKYIKCLERFSEKKKENPNMIYRAEYDKITSEQNVILYDLLTEKLESQAFVKRPNNPVNTLKKGKNMFVQAGIWEQVKCLMIILGLFGRTSGGCDLQTVGGAGKAAAMVNFSSSLSNWKKYFTNVCIIDQSASGLFEIRSDNLLDLL